MRHAHLHIFSLPALVDIYRFSTESINCSYALILDVELLCASTPQPFHPRISFPFFSLQPLCFTPLRESLTEICHRPANSNKAKQAMKLRPSSKKPRKR